MIQNHAKDLRAVLNRLTEEDLVASWGKCHVFVREVEFCGHVLREATRSPAPEKLLAIQKWEIPKTVTALRGFLGMTNYYSGYVKGYAAIAGPSCPSFNSVVKTEKRVHQGTQMDSRGDRCLSCHQKGTLEEL